MRFSNRQTIHKRFSNFVEWIAPDEAKEEEIKSQADEIRSRIKAKAEADGLKVYEMPFSGSFAKKTGLRRHLQGNAEVDGQDVDIAFILRSTDDDGNELGCLVGQFEQYLNESYPNCETGQTKSSATIAFQSSKLGYDLVPLFKTNREGIQTLLRTDGEERQTSVGKHKEFVRKRNASSNALPGRVRFNQCVRLIKWWRYHKQSQSGIFGNGTDDEKVPSFLLDLLCAHAYDTLSVQETYHETLARWFSYLFHVVQNRTSILFRDFLSNPKADKSAKWYVGDPMDDSNNIVEKWRDYEIDELADWLAEARDRLAEANRHDDDGNDNKSLNCLVILFGNSFKNHCD